jgi:glycosyltransferase involved in cell wall biosynthesis
LNSFRTGGGSPPTVSVILSFLNSAPTIKECLLDLLRQDYPAHLFDVVVVDAGSTDGSIQICRQLEAESGNMRLITMPGCTESEGQTAGIGASKGEIIMFTNSDIYVPRDWIRRHVSWQNNGFDLVGGRVFWGGDKYSLTWNMPASGQPEYEQQPGMGLGFSNCSVRRSSLHTAGGLPSLQAQHDTEFALRVVKGGGRLVLDPNIEVYHDHPLRSLSGSFRRSYGYARNHVIVSRNIYGRPVPGSSRITRLFLSSTIRELTLVNPVRVYRESYQKARQHAIKVGLLEFILIRLISTRLGQDLGILRGGTVRDVAASSIKDTHKNENLGRRKRADGRSVSVKEREIAARCSGKAGWPTKAARGSSLPAATERR